MKPLGDFTRQSWNLSEIDGKKTFANDSLFFALVIAVLAKTKLLTNVVKRWNRRHMCWTFHPERNRIMWSMLITTSAPQKAITLKWKLINQKRLYDGFPNFNHNYYQNWRRNLMDTWGFVNASSPPRAISLKIIKILTKLLLNYTTLEEALNMTLSLMTVTNKRALHHQLTTRASSPWYRFCFQMGNH